MADKSQQTEKATPHRLRKAREKGDFPSTRESVAAFQFLAFVFLGAAWFPEWFGGVQRTMRAAIHQAFTSGADSMTSGDLIGLFTLLARQTLVPLAVLGAVLMSFIVMLQFTFSGASFSMAKLSPDLSRLSPLTKLREVPGQNAGQFFQAVVMLPLMCWLTWGLVRDRLPDLIRLPLLPVASGASAAGELIHDAMRRASFVLAGLGAVMLIRERARYQKRLRMSKQEIRDEAKETDGNPQIKARVRRIQRDLRRRNMMREVPTATAIIVNPTHYAVALRYEQGTMAAPSVVAKGRNYLAARIRQRAIENQVPIIENPPLAQALYKSAEVGQDIPPYLYRAVAEILAYIFRVMAK